MPRSRTSILMPMVWSAFLVTGAVRYWRTLITRPFLPWKVATPRWRARRVTRELFCGNCLLGVWLVTWNQSYTVDGSALIARLVTRQSRGRLRAYAIIPFRWITADRPGCRRRNEVRVLVPAPDVGHNASDRPSSRSDRGRTGGFIPSKVARNSFALPLLL